MERRENADGFHAQFCGDDSGMPTPHPDTGNYYMGATRSLHERGLNGYGTKVRQGQGLSDGFVAHPDVFSPLYVQMVRVGKSAGALDRMLLCLTHHLEP